MADITITPANVDSNNAVGTPVIAGEAINAGEFVYLDATDGNKVKKADNTSVASAAVVGIAINTAEAAEQPVSYVSSGEVEVGSVLGGVGRYFVISAGGKCSPIDDVIAGDIVTIVGYAKDADTLVIDLTLTALIYA